MRMAEKAETGFKIGKQLFITAMIILLLLMIGAGVLTRVIPTGSYERYTVDGRITIHPDSFQFTDTDPFPVWRWFTAPVEVLWSEDGIMVIAIILFILIIGGSITLLNKSRILEYILSKIVLKYSKRKERLMAITVLVFMLFGAFLGIFEEIIPLVPFVIALAYFLGWDAITGLAMSLLAAGFGFSAAVANPFSVGIAQKLSGLPLFSGAWLRAVTFVIIYGILVLMISLYIKAIEKNPKASYDYENYINKKMDNHHLEALLKDSGELNKAYIYFISIIGLIVSVIISTAFVDGLSDYLLPIIGLLFLTGGLGASYLAGMSMKEILQTFYQGILGIAPGIVLILMATSVKYIIFQAGIMDTILFYASQYISNASPFTAIMLVYLLVLFLNFFIGSATAKAFLIMPIIVPLADILEIKRQMMVLAFTFGDGFSNVLYPTNAVLLIGLGLANLKYTTWFKWIFKIQIIIFLLTSALLYIALKIGYGPY